MEFSNFTMVKILTTKGANPVCSIVAVHGLNGDPYKTWTTKSGTCWLSDSKLLPKQSEIREP